VADSPVRLLQFRAATLEVVLDVGLQRGELFLGVVGGGPWPQGSEGAFDELAFFGQREVGLGAGFGEQA
jgi:hypothetical protein